MIRRLAQHVEQAEARIRPYVRQTILEPSPYYSQLTGANVYFKCENLQHTGSFKVRGVVSKLISLGESDRQQGVVAASTGNHGMALAYAASKLGAKAQVFVPENADMTKVEAIQRLGAAVCTYGSDSVETEVYARQYASLEGLSYVSPYNDPQVVAGQGTIGLELAGQLPSFDAVFVALGGGGLIAGTAGYLKSLMPGVQMVGCSPENSQVMIQSIKAGRIVDLPSLPTLSDGTAGGVEAGAITYELCQHLVDSYETVTEEEIARTLVRFLEIHHMLIEGSAAVPIAAFLKRADRFRDKTVVLVLCGANISLETLKGILEHSRSS